MRAKLLEQARACWPPLRAKPRGAAQLWRGRRRLLRRSIARLGGCCCCCQMLAFALLNMLWRLADIEYGSFEGGICK